jgi:uncharacterized OB-fold protein
MEIPTHWRLKAQRYRLEGAICPVCGRLTLPPRPVCPHCQGPALQVSSENQVSPFLTPSKEMFSVKG